jgi:hypothetical protein
MGDPRHTMTSGDLFSAAAAAKPLREGVLVGHGLRSTLTARPETTGQRLLVAAIAVAALVGLALAVLIATEEAEVRRNVGSQRVGRKVELIAAELSAFFMPITSSLETMAGWSVDPTVELVDPKALDALLVPLLDPLAAVSSLTMFPADGASFELARSPTGWSAEEDASRGDSELYAAVAGSGLVGEPLWLPPPDSDRSRGTDFVIAIRNHPEAARNAGTVIALTIQRRSVLSLLEGLPLLASGELLVLSSDGRLMRYSRSEEDHLETVDLGQAVSESRGLSAAGAALLEWRLRGGEATPFLIHQGGVSWWAVFTPVDTGDRATRIGVVVPEAELLDDLRRVERRLLWALAAILSLAVALVATLAVVNGRRLSRAASRRGWVTAIEEELLDLIDRGESETVEFKSTLRWNLKHDRPGKEVEKAALKTLAAFLNSRGGTLLIGVGDDGILLGIAQDQFPNEDRFLLHFNNLLKEHIGLENMAFLDFDLRSLGEHKILVVDCAPATEPVFYRHGKEEKFYVRVGPGTRELALSQVVEYLKKR